jgi:DNA-directed RNA polymerase specialized sigma24 family protein
VNAADTWQELYLRHHGNTTQWLCRRVKMHFPTLTARCAYDRAEDAVQEAWLQLVRRGLYPTDRMPGLLMKVARRALFEAARVAGVASRNERLAARPRTVALGWGAQLSPRIFVQASLLSEQRLLAWVLRYVQHRSLKEIAAELELAHDHAAGAVIAKANAVLRASSSVVVGIRRQ